MRRKSEKSETEPPSVRSTESAVPVRAPVLYLRGTHREMGQAHARQVAHLKPHLLQAVERECAELVQAPHLRQELRILLDVWRLHGASLLEMVDGLAAGLGIDSEAFLKYLVSSYLIELGEYAAPPSWECTAWAVGLGFTADGAPVLCKNRDYRPWHTHLEVVVLAEPAHGYRYGYVSSAGSPGVFSSGINERGLAVADTRVRTPDQGPGLPRYALMMEMLEHHDSVSSALEYLRCVPHMGGGNLILADAGGGMAVFEAAHSLQSTLGTLLPDRQYVVAANHFVSPGLAERWVDPSPPNLQGNSVARRAEVEGYLETCRRPLSISSLATLMAWHRGPLGSICRHEGLESHSRTVSGTMFFPAEHAFLFCHGYPCVGTYLRFRVGPGQEREAGAVVPVQRGTLNAQAPVETV